MNSETNANADPAIPRDASGQSAVFELLNAELDGGLDSSANADQMFEHVIQFYAGSRCATEMFEAMKMRLRAQLGLPIIAREDEPRLPDELQQQLENGLLKACRDAGTMLIQDGKISDGWMYLRVLDDKNLGRKLLASTEITDENYDEMIQVLLHEGVDLGRGFRAVIDHQGTCNSVTLFDQAIVGRSKQDRQAAAAELLDHFYDELTAMVQADVATRQPNKPAAPNPVAANQNLGQLLSEQDWLLKDGGYHLDTTHLSAVVRNASVLEDPKLLGKARELVQYGRGLHHEFQYPGDEPFVDFYPAYAVFYDVLLGVNVDAGLEIFRRKAERADTDRHGTAAAETYVDLLHRIGRHRDAVYEAIRLVPSDVPSQRLVPRLLQIAEASAEEAVYDRIAKYCQSNDDALGFLAAVYSKKAV